MTGLGILIILVIFLIAGLFWAIKRESYTKYRIIKQNKLYRIQKSVPNDPRLGWVFHNTGISFTSYEGAQNKILTLIQLEIDEIKKDKIVPVKGKFGRGVSVRNIDQVKKDYPEITL